MYCKAGLHCIKPPRATGGPIIHSYCPCTLVNTLCTCWLEGVVYGCLFIPLALICMHAVFKTGSPSDLDSHHGTHAPTYTNAHIHTHSKNNAKGIQTNPTFKEWQGLRPSQKHMLTCPHGKILIHQENVQSYTWTPSTHSAATENNSKLFSPFCSRSCSKMKGKKKKHQSKVQIKKKFWNPENVDDC